MTYRQTIRCANLRCEAVCGAEHAATHSDPGFIDLDEGTVVDDHNGDVYCSAECYALSHPIYCADCGDEKVAKAGERCTHCMILADQGEEAAYAWYRSQHPEMFRKPVASVDVSHAARRQIG